MNSRPVKREVGTRRQGWRFCHIAGKAPSCWPRLETRWCDPPLVRVCCLLPANGSIYSLIAVWSSTCPSLGWLGCPLLSFWHACLRYQCSISEPPAWPGVFFCQKERGRRCRTAPLSGGSSGQKRRGAPHLPPERQRGHALSPRPLGAISPPTGRWEWMRQSGPDRSQPARAACWAFIQ